MKKVLDKNIKYLKPCNFVFYRTKSGIKTYKIKNEVLIPRKPFKIVLGFRNSRSCIREFNQTKSPNMHKSRKNRLRNIKCTESEN